METLAPLTLAAGTTALVMYPVDVVRALRMASAGGENFSVTGFIRTHGIKGLASQGAMAEIVKSSVMRVSKFFFFPLACNGLWGTKKMAELTPLKKGLAGAMATVPEIFLITPLELAKLGLQTDAKNEYKNSSSKILRHIYSTRGGVGALWSGWAGLQLRNGVWTGTYFACLGSFKTAIEPPVKRVGLPQDVAQFTSGFLAGVFAATFNTPMDVVRSVVQRQMLSDPTRKAYGISPGGVAEHVVCLGKLIRERGVSKGLYPGFGFKALHLGGSGALMALFVPIFGNMLGVKYEM